ncbi:MAG: hypothetical protein GC157_12165 [Frankiales bacterium]|nr:hypothetical protein [Frankiales bacterium]
MPQYLLSVHNDGTSPYATEEEMQAAFAATGVFNDELQAEGAWVFAGGLEPHTTAKVVRTKGGSVVTTDGPYLEGKEHIGGFWIVEAPDEDAALALAARGSIACRGDVEVRAFQGIA